MRKEDGKIDRTQEEEEAKKEKELWKRGAAAKGIVAGSGLSALGGGVLVLTEKSARKLKKGGELVIPKGSNMKATIRNGRIIGGSALAIGLPTLGYSAYKHYKYKKEDKKNGDKA